MVFLLAQIEKAVPDELGGLIVDGSDESILKELGLATALGVTITDKETQAPAGMLIVAHDKAHHWKPNETYFLQAIGDQMMMSVSHTRLRSLVRRMGVSDEKSGLLSRSSYVGCLLNEADRARNPGHAAFAGRAADRPWSGHAAAAGRSAVGEISGAALAFRCSPSCGKTIWR